MTETTQEERDEWRNSPAEMVRRLTRDADRLATIEARVRVLADEMASHAEEMYQRPMDSYREGRADTADYYESRLRALIDPEQEPREAAPGQHAGASAESSTGT